MPRFIYRFGRRFASRNSHRIYPDSTNAIAMFWGAQAASLFDSAACRVGAARFRNTLKRFALQKCCRQAAGNCQAGSLRSPDRSSLPCKTKMSILRRERFGMIRFQSET
jgi:hypothetical protein